jgi:hypothetical protein
VRGHRLTPAALKQVQGWGGGLDCIVIRTRLSLPHPSHSCADKTWFRFRFMYVLFTSVCGQVQPLDVALSNSVRHSHAIAVPGCSSVLAGKLCTNEAIGAARSVQRPIRVRMSVATAGQLPNRAGGGCWKDGGTATCNAVHSCIRGAAPGTPLCVSLGLAWAYSKDPPVEADCDFPDCEFGHVLGQTSVKLGASKKHVSLHSLHAVCIVYYTARSSASQERLW